MSTFTFSLPSIGERKFTAHTTSKFHDVSDSTNTEIKKDKNILPGDIILRESPDPSTPEYGLEFVVLDNHGKQKTESYGDGIVLKSIEKELVKVLLQHNSHYFKHAENQIKEEVFSVFNNSNDTFSLNKMVKSQLGGKRRKTHRRSNKRGRTVKR